MVNNNLEPDVSVPDTTNPSTNPYYDPTLSHQSEGKLIYVPSSNVIVDDERNYYSSPPFSVSSSVDYSNTATVTAAATSNSTSNNYTRPNHFPATSISSNPAVHVPSGGQYRNINGRTIYVKQKNAHLPDEVIVFKQKRKRRTAASAWTGGVVGLFTLGPLGAIGGAIGGYALAKGVGKTREHRLTRKCAENAAATHSANTATSVEPQGTFT
jgi:hypothetical protein